MKKSLIIIGGLLLSNLSVVAFDSIYDGTGSLIHPLISDDEIKEGLSWGADRDEADMQPHKNKTSTVSFQVLFNENKCTHVDIHAEKDLNQDVLINVKSWDDEEIQESYRTRLSVYEYWEKNGVSIDLDKYSWATISVSSTKPITEQTPIYAYCRKSADSKTKISKISTIMTKLDNNYYYMGNGSLINMLKTDNGQWGYGIEKDEAVASNYKYNGETAFQIQGSETCKKVRITDTGSSKKIENILYKGWDKEDWRQSKCTELPCELNTFFIANDRPNYLLVKVRTRKNENNHLQAECIATETPEKINEKRQRNIHPSNCTFTDVSTYKDSIEAICASKILIGDEDSGYTKFKPNDNADWLDLTTAVELSANYDKMSKIRDQYSKEYVSDAYIDEAKKIGFNYPLTKEINIGTAVEYIVKRFWDKDLSSQEALNFLMAKEGEDKIDFPNTNLSSNITRGYMSYLVLKSARVSADENAINNGIQYIQAKPGFIPSKDVPEWIVAPKPGFIENIAEEKKRITDNMDKTVKSNVAISSDKDTTDNTTLSIMILGGSENSLKEEYRGKEAKEIFKIADDKGINTSYIAPITSDRPAMAELYEHSSKEPLMLVSIVYTGKNGQPYLKMGIEIKSGELDYTNPEKLAKDGYTKTKEVVASELVD